MFKPVFPRESLVVLEQQKIKNFKKISKKNLIFVPVR
jgi:hypothetical protein